MRAATLTAAVVISSLTLVGCGGNDGGITKSKAKTTTTSKSSKSTAAAGSDEAAIVAFFTDGGDELVVESEASCMAKRLDLSDAGMTTIRENSGGDLTSFSTADADQIVKSLDKCVDFDRLADALAEQITGSSGLKVSDGDAKCAAQAMTAEYEGPGEFLQHMTTAGQSEVASSMLDALGGCLSDDSATTLVADLLSQQGQTEEASRCVAAKLVSSMGAGPLLKAFVDSAKGSVDSDLAGQMASAMVDCGATTGDTGSGDTGSGGTGSGDTGSGNVGGGLSGN